MKKVAGATTTRYIFSGVKVIAEYVDGAAVGSPAREYIYSGSALLATIDGTMTTYHHQDHLSVRVNTDSNGSVVGQQGSYPFGEAWYTTSTTTKWRFTSYERDPETGNDYAIFRYHANRLGRFMTPDPLEGKIQDPQTLNRYDYSRNDPVNLADPLGLEEGFTFQISGGVSWVGDDCILDGLYVSCQMAYHELEAGSAVPGSANLIKYDPETEAWYHLTAEVNGGAWWMPNEACYGTFCFSTAGYSPTGVLEYMSELFDPKRAIDPDTLTGEERRVYERLLQEFPGHTFQIFRAGEGQIFAITSRDFYAALTSNPNYSYWFNPGTHGPYYDSYRQNIRGNSLQISLLPAAHTLLLHTGYILINADIDRFNPRHFPLGTAGHTVCDMLGLC